MKNSTPLTWSALLLLVIGVIAFIACGDQTKSAKDAIDGASKKVGDYGTELFSSNDPPCECEASWFPHSQTQNPPEGQGSPFDTSSTTNCMFHQWSWQKFLYLTKPSTGNLPVFLDDLIHIDHNMNLIAPQLGNALVLSSTGQAGGGGILKTDPAFNPPSGSAQTVYYSIHIDSTMYNSAVSFARQLKAGTIPASNSYSFPVNSLELKAAWVNIDAIPTAEQSNYFTTTASVMTGGNYISTTMALMGMHVVGRVINHPEFIWATFEHEEMAPLFDWTSSSVTASTNELVYGQGTTNSLAGIQWDKNSKQPKAANQAYTLFQLGIIRSPGGQFAKTSQAEPANFNHINEINACVADNLTGQWSNYFYKGSIWLNMDGLSPQAQADSIVDLGKDIYLVDSGRMIRGCVSLANLSMETFEQTFAGDISATSSLVNNSNCFACHNSESFANKADKSPLYLSHVFDGYMTQTVHNKSAVQIKALKKKQYEELRASIRNMR